VYISCNTKTLVQNLYYLEYYGYKVKYLKPFDNFPFTKHVECVVLMSKVK
jgi:23S rRNA (uracil1939-C5)-methyltransferase